ncbi:MAG: YitT family protein [Prevotellaceae bacterium]|jgi:uncharacterized membrane-anchored protein YitT (DUF2179 family)|nr:YitT family protein [Prevotellaceae bacterium]
MQTPHFIPKSIYPTVRELIMMSFGLILISCGWKWFLLPYQVTGGGATGVAAIIQFGFGINISITYFTINLFLLIIAIKNLGWKFSIKTIFGVVVLTAAFAINPMRKIGNFEPFMAVILGGLLNGAGIGIVFLNNGSSGGTDIIAKLITQTRNITLGRVMLYCDVGVISSSWLVTHSVENVIYGLVALAVSTITVDMVVNGVRQSVQFFIFSKEYAKIANAINIEVGRGVTLIDGTGWYSKEPVKIITVLARKHESTRIFRLVKGIDADAFVSQSSAIGVYGKGFDVMKGK